MKLFITNCEQIEQSLLNAMMRFGFSEDNKFITKDAGLKNVSCSTCYMSSDQIETRPADQNFLVLL